MATTDEEAFDWTIVLWVVISFASAAALAKNSKGLCAYLFLTIAWLYVTILVIQRWEKGEKDPRLITYTTVAAVFGWLLGTFVIWRARKLQHGFFIDTPN